MCFILLCWMYFWIVNNAGFVFIHYEEFNIQKQNTFWWASKIFMTDSFKRGNIHVNYPNESESTLNLIYNDSYFKMCQRFRKVI